MKNSWKEYSIEVNRVKRNDLPPKVIGFLTQRELSDALGYIARELYGAHTD